MTRAAFRLMRRDVTRNALIESGQPPSRSQRCAHARIAKAGACHTIFKSTWFYASCRTNRKAVQHDHRRCYEGRQHNTKRDNQC